MVAENPTWGAPRIHGELLMLGFKISEATVSRWMRRAPRSPHVAHRWLTFLRNHREAMTAMDFFTVPTLTFGILYCFFVIAHDRRRILHCNVTPNPQAVWVAVQLCETWEEGQSRQRFLQINVGMQEQFSPLTPAPPEAGLAVVDAADYAWLSQWNWCAHWSETGAGAFTCGGLIT